MASVRPSRNCKACNLKTHNEFECWGSASIVASKIIRANTVDERKYRIKSKQTPKQREQIKLPQRKRKRETRELAKKQQSIIPIQ